MKLYLMRHGETDWNREGRLQGQKDIPLNENGIAQMQRLGEQLRDLPFCVDKIISSPLARAARSAEIIAEYIGFHKPIVYDGDFLERSFGKAEGVPWSSGIDLSDDAYCAESAEALCRRAEQGIRKYLTEGEETVLVVAHGAILKAVITVLSPEPMDYDTTHIPIMQGNLLCGETDSNGKVPHFDWLFEESTTKEDEGCLFRSGGGLL